MASRTEIESHDRLLTSKIVAKQTQAEDVTKAIESQLAETILALGTPEAVASNRAQLAQAFEPARTITQDLNTELTEVADDSVGIQGLGEKDSQDLAATSALLSVTENEIINTTQETQNSIIDEIVLAGVAGTAVNQIAQNARYRVSGLQADSTDPEVRRLQRLMYNLQTERADPKEIAGVAAQIRRAIGQPIPAGTNLRENLRRKVQESVLRFDSAFSTGRARRKGVKRYRYEGGVIPESREFCAGLDGTVLTEEEIYDLWNSQDWQGKQPGDPFVVRGGYNCRHYWVPVEEDE